MTSPLSGKDLIKRVDNLLTTEVDGEVMAMSIDNGACYGFNRLGTRIWAMTAVATSVDAICAALLAEFDVAPEVCRREVNDLLQTLRAEGIVTVRPA